MTWTHATFTEGIHEAHWLVGPDGDLRAHDERSQDPHVARLRIKIRIYMGNATTEVWIIDAKCAPWNDQYCTSQFVFEEPATEDSSQKLVERAHRAAGYLGRFYAALRAHTVQGK